MFKKINSIWKKKKNNGQWNIEKYDKDEKTKIYILPMFCLHKKFRQNLHQQ